MGVATATFPVIAAGLAGTPGAATIAPMAIGAARGPGSARPIVGGAVPGTTLVSRPVGSGPVARYPVPFAELKYAGAANICWRAWRGGAMRLGRKNGQAEAPGFHAGFVVHPLTLKACAVISDNRTTLAGRDPPTLQASAAIAICHLVVQIVMHPLWTLGGAPIAHGVTGTRWEPILMPTLAGLTVASVLFVVFAGGEAT